MKTRFGNVAHHLKRDKSTSLDCSHNLILKSFTAQMLLLFSAFESILVTKATAINVLLSVKRFFCRIPVTE